MGAGVQRTAEATGRLYSSGAQWRGTRSRRFRWGFLHTVTFLLIDLYIRLLRKSGRMSSVCFRTGKKEIQDINLG